MLNKSIMSNYFGNLNKVFEFIMGFIGNAQGTLEQDKLPTHEFKYDLNDNLNKTTIRYTGEGGESVDSGAILTGPLRSSVDYESVYGIISITADLITVDERWHLKETLSLNSSDGSTFLKASALYLQTGEGYVTVHGDGSVPFYVESTSSDFATIKRIKVIYSDDGVRTLRFYTNLKGAMLDSVEET